MMGGVSGHPVPGVLGQVRRTIAEQPRIELHGWDPQLRAWHGPDELAFRLNGSRRILQKLRQLQGSWYGRLRAQVQGPLSFSFCGAIHDLGDAGVATIDLEGSPAGPLSVLLVVPAQRRARVRQDFAFEFVSFLRFQEGRESSGSEYPIHEYVHRVLAESGPATTLVFSIETRFVEPEVMILLSEQVERLTMSMIAWMAEKDASSPMYVS